MTRVLYSTVHINNNHPNDMHGYPLQPADIQTHAKLYGQT
jgi:hypothetical protein